MTINPYCIFWKQISRQSANLGTLLNILSNFSYFFTNQCHKSCVQLLHYTLRAGVICDRLPFLKWSHSWKAQQRQHHFLWKKGEFFLSSSRRFWYRAAIFFLCILLQTGRRRRVPRAHVLFVNINLAVVFHFLCTTCGGAKQGCTFFLLRVLPSCSVILLFHSVYL